MEVKSESNLKFLKTLLDAIPIPVFYKDINGIYLECNSAFADKILGLPKEKIVGCSLYDFPEEIPKNLADIYHRQDLELIQKPGTQFYESQVKCADGVLRDFLFSKATVKDNDGNVSGMIGVMIDITTHKRAEQVIRESGNRYRELFENIRSGVAVYKAIENGNDFVFKEFNRAGEKIENIKRKDIIGKRVTEAFPGVKDFGLFEVFQRVWRTGKSEFYPEAVYKDERTPDTWRENWVYKLPNDEVVAVYDDVTERKQAEIEVREREEKFRNLFNNAEFGMFRTKLDGSEMLDMNERFLDIIGRTRDEMLGSPSLIHWADPSEREEMVRRLEIDGRVTNFECRLLNKQGEARTCLMSSVRYRDQEVVEGSIIDITERKQAEETLSESKQIIEEIINAIPVRVFWKDKKLVYLGCNALFARDAGFADPKDIIGKDDYQLVWRDQAELYRDDDRQVIDSGSPKLLIEKPQRTPEGNTITLLTSKLPLRSSTGEISGVLGVYMDITDFKESEKEKQKLEAQLQQSQKMEAIGLLAGGIAHDFNNHLTTIIGYADFALNQVSKDGSLYSEIEEIRKAAQQAAALTRQLLAFSRKQLIQLEILNLNDIIKNTEKMLHRIIGEDIEFKTMFEPKLWNVKMDPGQIEQIIMNLVVNARDAMPTEGKLTIKTANVELDDVYFQNHGVKNGRGSYVMIAVTDTGIGMDEETQSRIFEPFFTTKKNSQGTGLGLSTVYGIVKQNNGHIWTYSEPAKGTTFKVYFPRIKADEASNIEVQLDENQLNGSETILLVEDSETLLKLTQKMLESYGYKILAARNGKEAMETFNRHDGPIHLLLTDVVMPGMSGRELVEQIQLKSPEVQVIYMSGYTDDTISKHEILYNDIDFIEKPFSAKGLGLKIREVLTQKWKD